MRVSARTLLPLLVLLCSACGDDGGPALGDAGLDAALDGSSGDAALPAGAVASFDVPAAGPVGWLSIPFPNELYRGADGTLDVSSGPVDTPLWTSIMDRVDEMDGFCRSCPLAFPITGELDPATLPADAGAGDAAAAMDPVVMMRLDGEGGLIPVEVDYSVQDGAVEVRAAGLRVLSPETSYVAALTSDLRAVDGSPLGASALFGTVRDGAGGGAEAERARASVGPALDALEAAGVTRERVVSLAVFRTRDTSTLLRQLAGIVADAPAPVATVDRVYRAADGTLDDLMGTPAEMRPGRDTPAAMGTGGEFALVHDAIDMVVIGTFEAPRVVEGTGTDIGFVRRGPGGAVQAGSQEPVPYLLVIPTGADRTNLPVAIAHTGNPGTRLQGLYVGNTMAQLGVATLSTDPFQMGARAPSATDLVHDARGGDLGPDGLSEHDNSDLQFRFMGVAGSAPGLGFHPGYIHGASAQIVSDGIATLRFLQEGDLAAIAGADPSLAGLSVRGDRIYWLGLSFGSFTGMSVVTARSGVAAAVFDVGPASMIEVGCHAPMLRPSIELVLGSVGVTGPFDGVDRRLCMNPAFALYRFLLEDIEPQSSLHYLLEAPLYPEPPPDLLFQYAGLDENIGETNGELVLSETGVPVGGAAGFPFADVTTASGPFSANRDTPNGTITAAGWYFPMASHVMLIEKDVESTVEPPVAAPFVMRDMPLSFQNPIEAVHAQIQAFFRSYDTAGRATVSAPPGG